jgi:hypothetical protein
MTVKKPQVGIDIELGNNLAFAVLPAITADMGNTVNHQHIVGGKLGVAGAEQIAMATGYQIFFTKRMLVFEGHKMGTGQ